MLLSLPHRAFKESLNFSSEMHLWQYLKPFQTTASIWKALGERFALMWTQYSPWLMVSSTHRCVGILGWCSHSVFSFRSVCGQSQSGGEWAEGHGVLQKGETLFTRTFPPFVGRLNWESFFFPKAPRQAIDFSCPDQCLAVTLHDPYQHYKNQCRCCDVYLCARGAGGRVALCVGTFDASLLFHPGL